MRPLTAWRCSAQAPLLRAKAALCAPAPAPYLRRQRRVTPLMVVASSSSSDAFPTPAERNRQLARRLREACAEAGGAATYEHIKRRAAEYRAGRTSAQELCSDFFSALGSAGDAEELWREMAELLPSPQLYGELMEAMRSMQGGRSASNIALDQQQPSVRREASSLTSAPGPSTPGAKQTGQTQQEASWSATARSARGSNSGADSHGGGTQQQRPARSGGMQGVEGPVASMATLLEAAGVHPNSEAARPAKPLPAAKRARGSGSATAARAVPADGTAAGTGGVLVWLRQDLRVHDNPTLCAAATDAKAAGGAVTFVFVHSPAEDGDAPATGTSWRPGAASLVWLHGALASLDADLQARYGPGAGVVYQQGPYAQALLEVARSVGAGAVYYSRRYEPAMQATDAAVQAELERAGLAVRSFAGHLLREPAEVRLDMGRWAGHFGTLMPFYRACEALRPLAAPLPPPSKLPVASSAPAESCGGLLLEDLRLAAMPQRPDGTIVDWAAPIREAWNFSEEAALEGLERFIAASMSRYESDRGFADGRCVSRLSPYLRWGQLSPRLMLHKLRAANCKQVSKTFWRRLVWRDLAYWQLHHWPRMAAEPMRLHYAAQEWQDSPAALRAWQRGATGWPLVDAGMRELWATGWMQQNARMAVACLLTEYLGLHWVHGARWFHDTLVDADLAINSMMWQNAGKSGLDQWQFTVLPTSKAMDPNGAYIRCWVPELARLPPKYLHEPWKAPLAMLAAAGVELGRTYPHRITEQDMQELRASNTAAIRAAREDGGQTCCDSQGYDLITVPPGATLAHDGQQMRVFTKPEYRGSGGSSSSAARRGPKQASGGAGSRRGHGTGGRGRKGADAAQRTLLEYVSRATQ